MVASSLSTELRWNYVPQDSLSAVVLGKSELITKKFDRDLGGGSVAIARCQCRARWCCMICRLTWLVWSSVVRLSVRPRPSLESLNPILGPVVKDT